MSPPTDRLEIRRDGPKIYSPIRQQWLVETPEERVRQEYVCTLVNEYGYSLAQMDEELELTGRGTGGARGDVVVWRSAADKADGNNPIVVAEAKADYVTIDERDYLQGELYARMSGAPFYVTHNNRETKAWRVLTDKVPGYRQEVEDVPKAGATQDEIDALYEKLKTFKEREFADLLRKCHDVIRNAQHLDPADAFDEIAKVLFVKVYVERVLMRQPGQGNVFTTAVLDAQIAPDPVNVLFDQTKRYFKGDRLFPEGSEIKLTPPTARRIVELLQVYNLSDTKEDVKGIAFERFLGRTFRGENLGQFFTPRVVVEFMIRMVDPKEGDVICDPACGSGGFLIRHFAIVRDQILDALRAEYEAYRDGLDADGTLADEERAALLKEKEVWMEREADQDRVGSRLWALANRCIYGTDANERAARMAKMNMVMHGDGHGGVHHHNGFLNVNGVFEGRFDIILTNPPFGANVERSSKVTAGDVAMDPGDVADYERAYGDAYREARVRAEASVGTPIGKLFDLGTNDKGKLLKAKTEILFIERCLDLLKPGGRLGIVLPEGVLNNPSLQYVRDYCEDRARIEAVVSLPEQTFLSTGATVKASLLFLRKFSDDEKVRYDALQAAATQEVTQVVGATFADRVGALAVPYGVTVPDADLADLDIDEIAKEYGAAKRTRDKDRRAELRAEIDAAAQEAHAEIATRSRALLKERFPYWVFLYDAEHVGITATGEPDHNELFPNPGQPEGTEGRTALETYRAFRDDPASFALDAVRAAEQEPDGVPS